MRAEQAGPHPAFLPTWVGAVCPNAARRCSPSPRGGEKGLEPGGECWGVAQPRVPGSSRPF